MRVAIASFALISFAGSLVGCGAPEQEGLVEPTTAELANALDSDSKADVAKAALKILPADAQRIYFDDAAAGAYLTNDTVVADFYFQAKPGVEFKLGAYIYNSNNNPQRNHGVSWKLARAYKNYKNKWVWSVVDQKDGKNGAATDTFTTTGKEEGLYLVTVGSTRKPENVSVTLGCGSATGCSTYQQPGQGCGGHTATPHVCDQGLYCSYALGQGCGFADQSGTCAKTPVVCNKLAGPPFCGCDGNTYNNHCDAARNGVSELHDGACVVDVTGDWEEIKKDQAHYDYTFNSDGTFTSVMQPGCVYTNPHCYIRMAQSAGTYEVDGTSLNLYYTTDFHSPAATTFEIGNQLTGVDFNDTSLTLSRK